jgi:hypothetical protein
MQYIGQAGHCCVEGSGRAGDGLSRVSVLVCFPGLNVFVTLALG